MVESWIQQVQVVSIQLLEEAVGMAKVVEAEEVVTSMGPGGRRHLRRDCVPHHRYHHHRYVVLASRSRSQPFLDVAYVRGRSVSNCTGVQVPCPSTALCRCSCNDLLRSRIEIRVRIVGKSQQSMEQRRSTSDCRKEERHHDLQLVHLFSDPIERHGVTGVFRWPCSRAWSSGQSAA